MKRKRSYAKPVMCSRKLVSNQAVAEQCWSPSHDMRNVAYYNDPGFGGVKFNMGSSGDNCGAVFVIEAYYNNQGNEITQAEYLAEHPEYTADNITNRIHSEVTPYMGGNDGTNFKSEGPVVPNFPDWQWSL